jgi:hypothetical protein
MAKAAKVGEVIMDASFEAKATCEIHSTLLSELSKNKDVLIEGERSAWPQEM